MEGGGDPSFVDNDGAVVGRFVRTSMAGVAVTAPDATVDALVITSTTSATAIVVGAFVPIPVQSLIPSSRASVTDIVGWFIFTFVPSSDSATSHDMPSNDSV